MILILHKNIRETLMKKITFALAAIIIMQTLFISCKKNDPISDDEKMEAQKIAIGWLKMMDEERYSDAFDDSARFFKYIMTKEDWIKTVGTMRKSFGKVSERSLYSIEFTRELPGLPEGNYLVIKYKTYFGKKKLMEIVAPLREKDGVWRISGYHVQGFNIF